MSRWIKGGLAMLLAALPALLQAGEFEATDVQIRLQENTYLLDTRIRYNFTPTVLEALEHGVPLTMEVHIQVRRSGAWVWEKDVTEQRLRTRLRYHPLTSLYEVADLDQDQTRNFVTRDAAIAALGEIEALAVAIVDQLEPDEKYHLELRADLDIESLPLPLRPMAYLTPSWNLGSGWSTWPLTR